MTSGEHQETKEFDKVINPSNYFDSEEHNHEIKRTQYVLKQSTPNDRLLFVLVCVGQQNNNQNTFF